MSDKWHGGKGDKARKVDQKKYSEGWDKIFGKDKKKQKPKTEKKNE